MKFVALLSGGKDSCLNIQHCIERGHELVCVANLCPPSDDMIELDSFMYQSAAHNAVVYLAQCFGVPLHKRSILHKAVNRDAKYTEMIDDEVEDMYHLLHEIKTIYLDIKGVSCGAIASNYQRFRLENVCNRLGLIPLTFLWNRPRTTILNEVIDRNIEAILVKVAGAGLDPYKHLGKSLSTLKPTLHVLHDRYGLDLCGEGGEYETFVLDMPCFKEYRIVLDNTVVFVDSDISVGNLNILKMHLERKDSTSIDDSDPYHWSSLEEGIDEIVRKLDMPAMELNTDQQLLSIKPMASYVLNHQTPDVRLYHGLDGLVQTSMIHASSTSSATSASDQLREIFAMLSAALQSIGLQLADLVFVHLYLADMKDFVSINAEYIQWFHDHPPSRSCISASLPDGIHVWVEGIAYAHSYDRMLHNAGRKRIRDVLHVQCMSDWAPMCIGPYSQANLILDSILFVAGQIPLDPGSMDIWQASSIYHQLTLCYRHIARIIGVYGSRMHLVLSCVIFVAEDKLSSASISGNAMIARMQHLANQLLACNCLESINEDMDKNVMSFDRSIHAIYPDENDDLSDESEDQISTSLPIHELYPITVMLVPSLPRGAPVEVEYIGMKRNEDDAHLTTIVDCKLMNTSYPSNIDNTTMSTTSTFGLSSIAQQWPFWSQQPASDNSASNIMPSTSDCHYSSDSTIDPQSMSSVLEMVSTTRSLDYCLSSGFIEINQADETLDRQPSINVDWLSRHLACQLIELFYNSKISIQQHLRYLRIFYRPSHISHHDAQALQSSLITYLNAECHGNATAYIPCIVIPVSSSGDEQSLLTMQYLGIDALQVQTENWINQEGY